MILTAVALSVAASQQTVSFSSGYYTLESVSKACRARGIPVAVSSACAKDLYAIRLQSTNWEAVRSVLQADERLLISNRGGSWLIDRAPDSLASERKMLRDYLSFVCKQVHRVYGRAESEYRYIQSVSSAEQQRLIGIVSGIQDPDPLMNAGNHLIYLAAGAHELPYHALSIPAKLSSPAETVPLGTWYHTELLSSRFLLMPDGDLEKALKYFRVNTANMDQEAMQARAQRIQMATKLRFDPLTASISHALLFYTQADTPVYASMTDNIVPGRFEMTVPFSAIAGSDGLAKQKAREAVTGNLLNAERFSKEIEAEEKTLSSVLLRWAEKTNTGLVSYVSPYTDFAVSPSAKWDLASALKSLNSDTYVEPDSDQYVASIAGISGTSRKPAIRPVSKLTATIKGDIVVIRNELRFLDGFAPVAPPALLASRIQSSRKLPIADLARLVGGLTVRQWKSGAYPKHYQYFCNPVAFKPIATAWHQSSELKDLATKASVGSKSLIPFSRLSATTRNILQREMREVAPLYDARQELNQDPLYTKTYLEKNANGDLTLAVERGEDWITFDVLAGKSNTVWHAKVKNITLDAGQE